MPPFTPPLTTTCPPLQLRASERVGYNERAAGVPAVGTALLVRPVISAAAQGELSGWHAGEVHAMLQGARFLVEVEGEAEMLEMRVEERGTAWRPAQDDDDGDVGAGDAQDEPRRRVTGKAKASAAAPAPAKKRANLNPLYPSSDESEAGHKERSAAVVHTHAASCKHCVVHSDMHHVMR